MTREKPGILDADVAERIDEMKRVIVRFYFDHEQADLRDPEAPMKWYADVTHAYNNLLVGNDMLEWRSTLTGLSTFWQPLNEHLIGYEYVENSFTTVMEKEKYYSYLQNLLQDLNFTSCKMLASCNEVSE